MAELSFAPLLYEAPTFGRGRNGRVKSPSTGKIFRLLGRKVTGFTKMSGGGNDFVVIDNRGKNLSGDLGKLARKLCQRRLSIGADGLLILEKSKFSDFKMRYFNADGSGAAMCGNGARCLAFFAYQSGIAGKEMEFETDDGIHFAEVHNHRVKLQMSKPQRIQLNLSLSQRRKKLQVSFINTGVPHTVMIVRQIDSVDVIGLGREIRYHPQFKASKGTNADFVEIMDEHNLKIRTYERGVEDETLACGTGCVAASIIGCLLRKLESPITCYTWGGEKLKVYFDEIEKVFLEGEVKITFQGKVEI